ncbi:MAG: C39 family peptidase [Candidatus Hydrogenedentes bacterium]|nr:C39 family peptidase [Candidatus Hydrogenedentota bacterium]
METRLQFEILRQPDGTTCGPTCLHAVYAFYADKIGLPEVIEETHTLEEGGTLAAFLGSHALRRGYAATMYTYNLQLFDPTWFNAKPVDLRAKLEDQLEHKKDRKLRKATRGYQEFLSLGGEVLFEDLNGRLIRSYLDKGIPILTGLSSTFLYRGAREFGMDAEDDDVRGEPSGHFVVLCGYDRKTREVLVADPLYPNPFADNHLYAVSIDRVICSILLGILTYDGNLLIIEPRRKP